MLTKVQLKQDENRESFSLSLKDREREREKKQKEFNYDFAWSVERAIACERENLIKSKPFKIVDCER